MDIPPGPLAAGQSRGEILGEVDRVLRGLPPGATVVVACSGGPDSTALAHLAAEARPDLELRLVHVRHGLRDDLDDVRAARTNAAWLGRDLLVLEVEVERDGRGLEAAARDARYAALRTAALQVRASAVLVGHTADDQAETVLLRLARGTGIDGLSGMTAVRDDIVRPMLRLRREDVHRFVELEGLPVAIDPTNHDPRVRRAVVRHELLPALARVAEDPVGSLVRLADLARDDARALDAAAAGALGEVCRVGPVRAVPDHSIDHGAGDPHTALARRVVRSVLVDLGGVPPDAATVSRVLSLPDGSAASLPGPVEVTSAGGWRAFAPRTLPTSEPVPVAEGGPTAWTPADVVVRRLSPGDEFPGLDDPPGTNGASSRDGVQVPFPLAGVWAPPPADPRPRVRVPGANGAWLVLALPRDLGPLTLRHRRHGDRVTTAGGTRPIQDVLVDAGVPRSIRDIWPLVVDESDAVVWCPGYAADEDVLRAGRGAPASQLRIEPGRV